MNICVKCGKESEYDSPENLCGEHWAEWWSSNENGTQQEAYDDAMQTVNESRKADGWIQNEDGSWTKP